MKISRAIGVFHVSKTGDDTNNGTSRSTAFATIGKAILAAQNRDTIKIGEGTYTENLVINEGLTIQSTSYSADMSDADIKKTIIKGTVNGGSVVSILNTEGVIIRGLAIQGSGDINTDEDGSSRGWVYEDGTVVPDDILDIIDWDSNGKMLSDEILMEMSIQLLLPLFKLMIKMRLSGATLIVVMLVSGLKPRLLPPQ